MLRFQLFLIAIQLLNPVNRRHGIKDKAWPDCLKMSGHALSHYPISQNKW